MFEVRRYEPRPISSVGTIRISAWSFKRYAIACNPQGMPSRDDWERAMEHVTSTINRFDQSLEEFRLGYLIYHHGFDSNFFVVSSWSAHNMLRILAWSSPLGDNRFSPVEDGRSICVWDMLVHAHERNAFVRSVLQQAESPDFDGYLKDVYEG